MSNNSESHPDIDTISQLTPADFEAQLNSEFEVDLNYFGMDLDGTPLRRADVYPSEATLHLKLVEVKRREPLSVHLRQEPFSLLFCGSHDLPLYNDSHVLHHAALGRRLFFLTPVCAEPGIHPSQHPEGRFYECVVN